MTITATGPVWPVFFPPLRRPCCWSRWWLPAPGGVLVVLGFKGRTGFRKEDRELFSIIASQVAPPLLMAGMVAEADRRSVILFPRFWSSLRPPLASAESFSLALGVVLLEVRGVRDWAAVAEGAPVVKFMEHLSRIVRENVDPKYAVYRPVPLP
jgi:hypothetical protein